MHSVPQPRFSVDYTPVVRLSDEESLRNRSSPCTAAPEPKVPRATRETKNEYAQTAKGTPLCKHRGMPSETLVRNSSHSSPRAFVSRSSREKREKPAFAERKRLRRTDDVVVVRSRTSSVVSEKKSPFAMRADIRASVRTASPSSSVCSVSADSSAHAARRSAASGNRSGVAYAATPRHQVVARAPGLHRKHLAVAAETGNVLEQGREESSVESECECECVSSEGVEGAVARTFAAAPAATRAFRRPSVCVLGYVSWRRPPRSRAGR